MKMVRKRPCQSVMKQCVLGHGRPNPYASAVLLVKVDANVPLSVAGKNFGIYEAA